MKTANWVDKWITRNKDVDKDTVWLFQRMMIRKVNKLPTEDTGVDADKDYVSRDNIIKLILGGN